MMWLVLQGGHTDAGLFEILLLMPVIGVKMITLRIADLLQCTRMFQIMRYLA